MKDTILSIKKELRANMNGIASAAMRQTDDYRVNFGVELPRLQAIASEFTPDYRLAQELWKERIRECRILATILYPIDEFFPEIADIWVEDIRTTEIAQIFCMNILCHLPNAGNMMFEWMASDSEMKQYCAFLTLCRVIRNSELSERSVNEFLDQSCAALQSESQHIRSAAFKCLQQYASISKGNNQLVGIALRNNKLEHLPEASWFLE